jgi:anti-sigma regulatory factor (Ser/Thr protein kinase)
VEAVTLPVIGAPPRSALHSIEHRRDVATIRAHAMEMGIAHGLDAHALDRLRIVVTETALNIVRHAGNGKIILRPLGEIATGSIELLALDKGRGISDMTRVLRDDGAPSSAAPPDGGLAAVRRVADTFDIYSQVGRGTAVVAHIRTRFADDGGSQPSDSWMHACVGVVCLALEGEVDCGDSWAVDVEGGRMTALLVDGLGHGPEAAAAALAAISVFRDAPADPPELMLGAMHQALHDTRGAAVSVTRVDRVRGTARFCGVGNVDGRVATPDRSRYLIPQSGIVGHTMPRAVAAEVPWPVNAHLVMYSDGVSPRWQTDKYPGLFARHPALLAGVLFRDCARKRDDATVLVLRDVVTVAAQ